MHLVWPYSLIAVTYGKFYKHSKCYFSPNRRTYGESEMNEFIREWLEDINWFGMN